MIAQERILINKSQSLESKSKLTRAIKSSQELTRAHKSNQERSTYILYFLQISIYSSLFFGKAMNENEFETKQRNLSKL